MHSHLKYSRQFGAYNFQGADKIIKSSDRGYKDEQSDRTVYTKEQ